MTRTIFLLMGLLFVGLGIVGAFLPLLPTVPLLLLALWCFARSSQRFHDWLYFHPRWGPPLQSWQRDGVIPNRVKLLACSMMALSFAIVLMTTNHPVWLYALIGIALACIGGWIATRPGTVPVSHKPDPAASDSAFQKGENSP